MIRERTRFNDIYIFLHCMKFSFLQVVVNYTVHPGVSSHVFIMYTSNEMTDLAAFYVFNIFLIVERTGYSESIWMNCRSFSLMVVSVSV